MAVCAMGYIEVLLCSDGSITIKKSDARSQVSIDRKTIKGEHVRAKHITYELRHYGRSVQTLYAYHHDFAQNKETVANLPQSA